MINWPNNPALLSAPIGMVAYDAGAANLMAGWIGDLPLPIYVYVEGPALNIFKQKLFTSIKFSSFNETMQRANIILTGTGWSSDLEHRAREYAQKNQKICIAVIDHWVNYKARFIRETEVLPDAIIITDHYSQKLAQHYFMGIPILCWRNNYLDAEVKKIKSLRSKTIRRSIQNILIIMEPIREVWLGICEPGEFVAVDFFITNLNRLKINTENVNIRIRPHPSEPVGKYDAMTEKYKPIILNISNNQPLSEDIAWADLVAGCESFALVIALTAGIYTMSILPPEAHQCRLPHKKLKHLRHILSKVKIS